MKMCLHHKTGEKLFSAAFVVHNGFLPAKGSLDVHSSLVDPCAPSGSLVIDCPWDSGSLDLPLLSHVPQNEDALHLAQRVLLRGLLRRQRRAESDIPNVVRLWELGCWQSLEPTCGGCETGISAVVSDADAQITSMHRE